MKWKELVLQHDPLANALVLCCDLKGEGRASIWRAKSEGSSMLQSHFRPAAVTRCLNTGLLISLPIRKKGFIRVFAHNSKTSVMNWRIASSVCGLVGLCGIDVDEIVDARLPAAPSGVVAGW